MLGRLLGLVGLKQSWPEVSAEEAREHSDTNSLWIVSGNSVYDITDILECHPGGADALLRRAGGLEDCKADYEFHSYYARNHWDSCKVGEISEQQKSYLLLSSSCASTSSEGEKDTDSCDCSDSSNTSVNMTNPMVHVSLYSHCGPYS